MSDREFYRKQTENQHEKFVVKFHTDSIDNPPSRYYIVDALQHFIFIKARERSKAQAIVDSVYGKNFYKIRFMGMDTSNKEVNAR